MITYHPLYRGTTGPAQRCLLHCQAWHRCSMNCSYWTEHWAPVVSGSPRGGAGEGGPKQTAAEGLSDLWVAGSMAESGHEPVPP